MENPEINAGQIWQQRNSIEVEIDEILEENGTTPVRSGNQYWMLNGRYWDPKFDHPKDSIKLIK